MLSESSDGFNKYVKKKSIIFFLNVTYRSFNL